AVGVSPDGATVVVTGVGLDSATLAYDAATGTQLWLAVYNESGYGGTPYALGISPDGAMVFVTGDDYGSQSTAEGYGTVAYDAATGAELWVAIYNGPADGIDFANSLGVSPDGATVFVTGSSQGSGTQNDYATVAYDAATGTQLWVTRYNARGDSND